jgi:hypothetical protein
VASNDNQNGNRVATDRKIGRWVLAAVGRVIGAVQHLGLTSGGAAGAVVQRAMSPGGGAATRSVVEAATRGWCSREGVEVTRPVRVSAGIGVLGPAMQACRRRAVDIGTSGWVHRVSGRGCDQVKGCLQESSEACRGWSARRSARGSQTMSRQSPRKPPPPPSSTSIPELPISGASAHARGNQGLEARKTS